MTTSDDTASSEDMQDSFEFAKRNMHFALQEMRTVMKLCSEYIQNTTQLDAADIFANLGKTYTMMNKNLLDFEERSRKSQLESPQSNGKPTENGSVIYASTSDIQQALRVVQRNSNVEPQK